MKKVAYLLAVGLICAVCADAMAARGGSSMSLKRMGIGLSTDRADLRFDLDGINMLGASVDFQNTSGDATSSDFAFGGYFLQRFGSPKPVALHWLAGLDIVNGTHVADEKSSNFELFAGLGAEYFLPGTDQLSIEANVVVGFDFGSQGDIKTTTFDIGNLNNGVLMLRYYFE